MILRQPILRFLGVIFDGDHDSKGPRSPKAHLDTVLRNLSHHLRHPCTVLTTLQAVRYRKVRGKGLESERSSLRPQPVTSKSLPPMEDGERRTHPTKPDEFEQQQASSTCFYGFSLRMSTRYGSIYLRMSSSTTTSTCLDFY